ncbi:hypothetical protein EYR40_007091 [Pleurotus pulmonarius]|nr:hypothetical protein EYR36_003639 [Pleurotus pulmonarius]KAF4599985.1 hypothetical protein EYR40_007091 [Pleurotus pulmonarius]
MPINTLTTQAGLKIGPIVFETLVKHYFDRVKKDLQDGKTTQLRQEELLYDQAFTIIKAFLETSTYHTVEEVQDFSNTRIPAPPWVRVVRLLVPLSCCEDAASYLIQAFGGEEMARRVVGGIKWWQVRGSNGVDGQWIAAKKDWREAKRKYKMQEAMAKGSAGTPEASPNVQDQGLYEEEMDEMRCILYLHGGGYYFGSVDQERYSIQRYARKINGRVFAINYRLAPQYPFPCALQDALAAYLYLIRPPADAAHRPVKPSHIVVAGDSAGGGLSLALLQVIRDTDLPMPAGGVLISPWCDLTHSFPSIHMNTATDVIPTYGLSLQKPSSLWPPPSDEMTTRVHASLRSRLKQALHLSVEHSVAPTVPRSRRNSNASSILPVDIGSTTCVPQFDSPDSQKITIATESGETLTIDQQVHLYTENHLIVHPLVSPALSYLGGLPPLLVIASEKEVLRDEIIYTAHKAAYPSRFSVRPESRALYPPLNGIEARHPPTQVHLQVYDDAAHVLPVLFSFTTPGKFCFRAMAAFCKHVTGMPSPESPMSSPAMPSFLPRRSSFRRSQKRSATTDSTTPRSPPLGETIHENGSSLTPASGAEGTKNPSLRRSLSAGVTRISSVIRRKPRSRSSSFHQGDSPLPTHSEMPSTVPSSDSSLALEGSTPGTRSAGDGSVYKNTVNSTAWTDTIIRERVSTRGIIRPLEPESELDAFKVPQDIVGSLSELAIRRYLDGKAKFDHKFAHAAKSVEKERHRQLERAKKDPMFNMKMFQNGSLARPQTNGGPPSGSGIDKDHKGIKDGLLATSGTWAWAWVVDANERPPPSSIVSRRDTQEARRLARFAEAPLSGDSEKSMSANNLWSVLSNTLTASREKRHPTSSPDVARHSKFSVFSVPSWKRTIRGRPEHSEHEH